MRYLLFIAMLSVCATSMAQTLTGPSGYGQQQYFYRSLKGMFPANVSDTTDSPGGAKHPDYFKESSINGVREGMIIRYTADGKLYELVKDGASYYFKSITTSPAPPAILNQFAAAQNASFWITGQGRIGNALQIGSSSVTPAALHVVSRPSDFNLAAVFEGNIQTVPAIVANQAPTLGQLSDTSSGLRTWASARLKIIEDSLADFPTRREADSSYSLPVQRRIPFRGAVMAAFGDSWIAGVGASQAWKSIRAYIINALGITINNYSVSGSGAARMNKNSFENLATTNINTPVMSLTGLNDLWKTSGNFKSIAKIYHGYRSLMANQFLATAVPANGGTVSTSGTWTTLAVDTMAGKANTLSGLGRKTTQVGATLTVTFTGSSFVFGTFGTDGVQATCLPFSVTIDGIGYGNYDLNGITDGVSDGVGLSNIYQPAAIFISSLGAGAHTAVITTLSGSGSLVADYFGTFRAARDCAPVFIAEIAHLSKSGYNSLMVNYGKTLNDSIIDVANLWIRKAAMLFPGYPVAVAKTGYYFTPEQEIIPNDIHPNDDGHQSMARTFMSVMGSDRWNLNDVTAQTDFNSTSNIVRFSGFNNAPTAGSGMIAAFNPTVESGTGFLYSYNSTASTYLPLALRGSKVYIDQGMFGVGAGMNTPTSTLHVRGSTAYTDTATVSNFTAGAHRIIQVTSTAHAITLPDANTCRGRVYCIQNYNTGGAVAISSVLVYGTPTTSIPNNTQWTIYSNGTNWILLSRSN